MGLGNRLKYFLLVPDVKSSEKSYFDVEYHELFGDLADKDFFDALVLLNKRDSKNAFNGYLFEKNLGVTPEKAVDILGKLSKYELVTETQIEMNDEQNILYTFLPSPAFVGLLIFAHELIKRPNFFNYFYDNREKPYLN